MNCLHSQPINQTLASEVLVSVKQVDAFIALYDDGNTVPFIARYRKEATSGLDDCQLRLLETRLIYLRELEMRRNAIFKSLHEQNKLTAALQKQIVSCQSKRELELVYQPFKSKRISKGALAIEAGIEPLADQLWFENKLDSETLARKYINRNKGFNDIKAVLDGALAIMVERLCNDIELLTKLQKQLLNSGVLVSCVVKGSEQKGSKYKDYFAYRERLNKIAAHRILALLRGKSDGFLKLKIEADSIAGKVNSPSAAEKQIAHHLGFSLNNLATNSWRAEVLKKAWRGKLSTLIESQLLSSLKEQANNRAIDVFASNLKDLLMAAPAGRKVVLGLDPGFRTGCKAAVIDKTGKLLDYATLYPHPPAGKKEDAEKQLLALTEKYHVDLIAIGNGTASRETDAFVRETLTKQSEQVTAVIVSEAGASVYSASQLASLEFPQLDVSIRGAVSIARRLQDPLSELVKIDAKAIGVGLYQHDLPQTQLNKRLQSVVEDCVNAVGVDLNSASSPLLSFIAGLNQRSAENIVAYRDNHGMFSSRQTLKKVARLGEKAFQQAAGFLRIPDAANPLDNSAVHPEAYAVVSQIAKQQKCDLKHLVNNLDLLSQVNIEPLVNEQFGYLSIKEIVSELGRPSRDPRPKFATVNYTKGIDKLSDLSEGMQLQGVVSNVTSFGAFVDIGVHQDGLVHISQLADKFVSDPLQVVKVGEIVSVKVTEIDIPRKRIALTMRSEA